MKELKELLHKTDDITRRHFAASLAMGAMGVGIAGDLAAGAAPGVDPSLTSAATLGGGSSRAATSVIYFYMGGGMSHLDTFDPKPGNKTVQGPTGAISTAADGIQVSEHFPDLAKQMKHVSLVRSVSSTQGAHEQGNYLMHTSYTPRGTIKHPCMGSWAVKLKGKMNATLPGFVLIGGGGRAVTSGFLENKYGPAPVGNPRSGLQNSRLPFSEKEFQTRLQLADTYDRAFRRKYQQKQVRAYTDLYAEAIKMLNSEDLKAFDISEESKKTFDDYGNSYIGQAAILARRLVEKKVRFIEVNYGGWDNHAGIFGGIGDRCRALDKAMAALIRDLKAKGLLDSTLIVLSSEFGRTPRINQNAGRDHHPACFTTLLAGGGIRGGQVHGKSDEGGFKPASEPTKIQDFNATVATAMGLPIDKVIYSPSKRPFQVANRDGKPIESLLRV